MTSSHCSLHLSQGQGAFQGASWVCSECGLQSCAAADRWPADGASWGSQRSVAMSLSCTQARCVHGASCSAVNVAASISTCAYSACPLAWENAAMPRMSYHPEGNSEPGLHCRCLDLAGPRKHLWTALLPAATTAMFPRRHCAAACRRGEHRFCHLLQLQLRKQQRLLDCLWAAACCRRLPWHQPGGHWKRHGSEPL